MNKLVVLAMLVAFGAYIYTSYDGFHPEMVRGKRVLITGSSSGIGEHLAYEYAKLGAKLMLTARRQALLDKVALKCRSLGAPEVHVLAADMGASDDRIRLVKATEKAFGGLDHLILNHADLSQVRWRSTAKDIDDLKNMMNVNFVSFVDLTAQFLPSLKKSSGHVGVVSSIAGKMAIARSQRYAASKHALHGFFTSWRQDLRHDGAGVSFTMCVLGPISTDIVIDMMKKMNPNKEVKEIMGAATPHDTAVAILRSVTVRAREMCYGRMACIITWLHKICPSFIDDKLSDYFFSEWPEMGNLE